MAGQSIAVVGVGRMGANMARRLKDKGHRVSAVHDVRRDSATALAEELGCPAPESLKEVTAAADVILTVVTDNAAMRGIFAPEGDSLLIGAAGKFFINCATVSPSIHLEVSAACDAVGASALEACMASSITQARNGTLYLMVGGSQESARRQRSRRWSTW